MKAKEKGGKDRKEGRTREMGAEDSREDDGDTEEHVNVMNTNTGIKSNQENRLSINNILLFLKFLSFIGRKSGFEKREFSQRSFTELLADRLASLRFPVFAGLTIAESFESCVDAW